jgi:hypothetical protein
LGERQRQGPTSRPPTGNRNETSDSGGISCLPALSSWGWRRSWGTAFRGRDRCRCRFQGTGLRAQGAGRRVQVSGYRSQGTDCRAQGHRAGAGHRFSSTCNLYPANLYPLIPQRHSVLAVIGGARQGACVRIDHDGLSPAHQRAMHDAGRWKDALVAALGESVDDGSAQ